MPPSGLATTVRPGSHEPPNRVSSVRPAARPPSIVPPSRFFPAPQCPFDTEVAVLGTSCVVLPDVRFEGVTWVASEDLPDAPLTCIVRRTAADALPGALCAHLLRRLRDTPAPSPALRTIVVEDLVLADRLAPFLAPAGLARVDETFFGVGVADLADGERLVLDPLVGDDAWRDWIAVERPILDESVGPGHSNEALLHRTVQFKRRQQRHSPPIRRFVGRAPDGEPIAMIGYAPFASCDLGFATAGPLVRLRDVAVVPSRRRSGVARALLRAVAAMAMEECGATQVLICGNASGAPAALYRGVGARPVGACVVFRGEII